METHEVLDAAYRALLEPLSGLDETTAWRPTRCTGWVVRDLVLHLLGDARRALVALHTPADGPADVDAVSYWNAWRPGTADADDERRHVRLAASAWPSTAPLVEQYAETAHAVLDAARGRSPHEHVRTQGHVLTTGSLLSTLVVEATVHQLDLGLGEVSAAGSAEVRRVLDGLLGHPAPFADTVRYALVGTGREPLRDDERALLGASADRLPLFG
ncbi:maleylpyruvate isomerase N-terminal domain-containing protein [Umezawaea beigongshangensis]|uniref:maleylpyruvate isomerase N-terminal domain-containing protein n=1 Tax=Umezawaea beigongshangensis TaxID=2780383 RepID=UPI0018F1898A|nr:maleylpyruvate isomerase N-terminal domain-containing protein [Umezawaea beigongshangensis]